MEDWLQIATRHVVTLIDLMALVLVAIGTLEAFVNGLAAMLTRSATSHRARAVWLRYVRWLVGGLTFQLAADILETAIAPTWQDLARLAAIAAIRTFLNYFLERDLEDVLRRENEGASKDPPTSHDER